MPFFKTYVLSLMSLRLRYDSCINSVKMNTMYRLLIASVLFHLSLSALGQTDTLEITESDYFVIKDLRSEWLTVDEENRYVPFISNQPKKGSVIGIPVDLTEYQGNKLRCCAPKNSSLLINQQLIRNFDGSGCIYLSIDSLRDHHAEKVFLTVFQAEKDFSKVSLEVVNFGQKFTEKNQVVARAKEVKMDFFVVGLLILLVFYATLKHQYTRSFKAIYDIPRIFSSKVREDDVRVKLLNEAHILFLIQHCLLIAFLLIIIVPPTAELPFIIPYVTFPLQTFSQYILLWAELALIVFITIWVKYLLLMLLGSLFRLRAMKYLHMFDFMRMSLVFWAGVFVLIICFFPSARISEEVYVRGLIYGFLAFALLRIVVLYLRLAKNASFRNIYLFSYICVAEIIPLLAGLELLVG